MSVKLGHNPIGSTWYRDQRLRKIRAVTLNPKTERKPIKELKQIFYETEESVIVKLYAFPSYHLCGLNNNTAYIVL